MRDTSLFDLKQRHDNVVFLVTEADCFGNYERAMETQKLSTMPIQIVSIACSTIELATVEPVVIELQEKTASEAITAEL